MSAEPSPQLPGIDEQPPPADADRRGADAVKELVGSAIAAMARMGRAGVAGLGDALEGPATALARRQVTTATTQPQPIGDEKALARALGEHRSTLAVGGATGAALLTKVAGRVGPLRFLARRTPMWMVLTAGPALYSSVAHGAEELGLVASHLAGRARTEGHEPDPERVRRAAVQVLSGQPVDPETEPRHTPLAVSWLQRGARAALPFAGGVATRNPDGLAAAANRVDPASLAAPTAGQLPPPAPGSSQDG